MQKYRNYQNFVGYKIFFEQIPVTQPIAQVA
jgi:hypothetical protein